MFNEGTLRSVTRYELEGGQHGPGIVTRAWFEKWLPVRASQHSVSYRTEAWKSREDEISAC
jgi:hypothetical protein